MESYPKEEVKKYSEIISYTKVLIKILSTINTEFGIYYTKEVAKDYKRIRDWIVVVGNAWDVDVEPPTSYIGIGYHADYDMPDSLEEYDIKNQDYLQIEQAIEAFSELLVDLLNIVNVTFELGEEEYKFFEKVNNHLYELETKKKQHLTALGEGVDKYLYSITISDLKEQLDFSFVENEDLRKKILHFLNEAIVSYENSLYISSIVLSKSLIESLLVISLDMYEDIKADAKITYKNTSKNTSSYIIDHIDRWELPALLNIAKDQKIIKDNQLYYNIKKINKLRNIIHIHNMDFDFNINLDIALLSFSSLISLYNEVEKWCISKH